jgi:lipoprotein NlpD
VLPEPPLTELAKAEPVIMPGTAPLQGPIKWRWPAYGNLIRSNTPIAQKGLDISGDEGQDIMAAADGVVVYSGSGLLGYGKLIIIKHDDTYLSAYAHNQMIHVKEGDNVSAGQKIGTMGRGNRGEPLLHFEIRKDGKTVDPIRYLPARS